MVAAKNQTKKMAEITGRRSPCRTMRGISG
jgi:hypothetical protein